MEHTEYLGMCVPVTEKNHVKRRPAQFSEK
jgi:hypothetical protein